MFKQPCFIKRNTSELREKLENLGYKYKGKESQSYNSSLYCIDNSYYECNNKPARYNSIINCETNEELFLAIASLRDDTDENQWFIIDIDVYSDIDKGDWFKATDIGGGFYIGIQIEPLYCHKATVKELIEHFKNR